MMGLVYEVDITSSLGYISRFSVYDEYISGTAYKCRDECIKLILCVLHGSGNWKLIQKWEK